MAWFFRNRAKPEPQDALKLSQIFSNRGYLFVCEFCEFEGAKPIYTFPDFQQQGLENSKDREDICIKKRLARQFLSSDHCVEGGDGPLSLEKEAQFYQEIEIGGNERSKPLMLHCLGTMFKLYDVHSRGNVKACCIALVTSENDKVLTMRRYWMKTLHDLVTSMKEANLTFHYFQMKKYVQVCGDFESFMENNASERSELVSDGYAESYYEDEAKKGENLIRKLEDALKFTYNCNTMTEVLEKIHRPCRDIKKETPCPQDKWPSRDEDGTQKNFRKRVFDSLPSFKVILGCQFEKIFQDMKRTAALFDEASDAFCLDNNDSYFGKYKARKPFVAHSGVIRAEKQGFTYGRISLSSFVNYMTMLKANDGHPFDTRPELSPRDRMPSDASYLDIPTSSNATNSSLASSLMERSDRLDSVGFTNVTHDNTEDTLVPEVVRKSRTHPSSDSKGTADTDHEYNDPRSRRLTWVTLTPSPCMHSNGQKRCVTLGKYLRRLRPYHTGTVSMMGRSRSAVTSLTTAALIGLPIHLMDYPEANPSSDLHISDELRSILTLFLELTPNPNLKQIYWSKAENVTLLANHFSRSAHESNFPLPFGVAISCKNVTVSRKIKHFLPSYRLNKNRDNYQLKTKTITATDYCYFTRQIFNDRIDLSDDYQRVLYQGIYLLELVHFASFALFVLKKSQLRDSKEFLTCLIAIEKSHKSVCFNGELKDKPGDQTIICQLINSIILHIGNVVEKDEGYDLFHWIPCLNTSLLRTKNKKSRNDAIRL